MALKLYLMMAVVLEHQQALLLELHLEHRVDQTTFTIDVDSAFIFGTGALAANVKVEVLDNAAPFETVYPLVERSGSGTIAIKFTGDVAVDLYQVLLSHI